MGNFFLQEVLPKEDFLWKLGCFVWIHGSKHQHSLKFGTHPTGFAIFAVQGRQQKVQIAVC